MICLSNFVQCNSSSSINYIQIWHKEVLFGTPIISDNGLLPLLAKNIFQTPPPFYLDPVIYWYLGCLSDTPSFITTPTPNFWNWRVLDSKQSQISFFSCLTQQTETFMVLHFFCYFSYLCKVFQNLLSTEVDIYRSLKKLSCINFLVIHYICY